MSKHEDKKQYVALVAIGWSGRQEKGAIISLTDHEAAAFSSAQIAPYESKKEVVADEAPLEERDIKTLKITELRELAAKLELDTEGSKADLLERIEA